MEKNMERIMETGVVWWFAGFGGFPENFGAPFRGPHNEDSIRGLLSSGYVGSKNPTQTYTILHCFAKSCAPLP